MLMLCLFVFLNLKYIITIGFVHKDNLNTKFQVNTTTGFVQGRQEYSEFGTYYYSYIGIPYAKPPIGNLRFSSPKPLERWSGVIDATVYGPCCLSLNITSLSRTELMVRGKEDCLYLNVYSPQDPSKSPYKDTLAVMMYVHGGGFVTGCGSGFHLGPDLFIENEVILVIPNYRLGIFGFLSTEDMECTGNWALKDVLAALKWIQQNIKRFGGNRRKVTIFGQSAGAAMVNVILMSPKANGLIHRAILMSGTILSFWAYQTKPKTVAFDVGKAMGVNANGTKILIQQLRNIKAEVLINSQKSFVISNSLNVLTRGLPFTPSIEPKHEEAVWTSGHPYELFERGRFNVIPVMLGVTSLEFLTFASGFKYENCIKNK